jgi:5-methylthioribose kinase
MKILLNTDYNISGSEKMRETLKAVIKDVFDRFSEHITKLEGKFRDESSYQYGENNRKSVLEKRLKGMQPLAVASHKTPFNRYMPQ